MAAPEIQKQIIKNIEELLKVNITDTKIPPQGMEYCEEGKGVRILLMSLMEE